MPRFWISLIVGVFLVGCIDQSISDQTVLPDIPILKITTPTDTPNPKYTPTLFPPTPLPTQTATPELLCETSTQILDGHFILQRPIPPEFNQKVDKTYRYGQTQSGKLIPHSGVEFRNPSGTPVIAAADGIVVFAGEDTEKVIGKLEGFYGNAIIIEHIDVFQDTLLYTLYAHLSEIDVEIGQTVDVGDVIGAVGLSGVAEGSHLHFEVRFGENNYSATRNPELWLQLLKGEDGILLGAIAGRVIDQYGNQIEVREFTLRDDYRYFIEPYTFEGINSDQDWQEHIGISEVSPGFYAFSFNYKKLIQQDIEVQSGQLTLVTFCIEH